MKSFDTRVHFFACQQLQQGKSEEKYEKNIRCRACRDCYLKILHRNLQVPKNPEKEQKAKSIADNLSTPNFLVLLHTYSINLH